MQELRANRQWAYRPAFISKRFRELLIENGIIREVINMHDNNYG